MKVFLIRHTRVALPQGICYGRSDIALADSFSEERDMLAAKIPEYFDEVYSSPLQRCWKLAEVLKNEPVIDRRLLEYDFGSWELQPWDDIHDNYAQQWFADYINVPAPRGESYLGMAERVHAFWDDVCTYRASSQQRIAVCSHAGVIRLLLGYSLQMPLEATFSLALDYGGVSLIEVHREHTQVQYINR